MSRIARYSAEALTAALLLTGCTSEQGSDAVSEGMGATAPVASNNLTVEVCDALSYLGSELGRVDNIPGGGGELPVDWFGDENGVYGEVLRPGSAADGVIDAVERSNLDPSTDAVKKAVGVAGLASTYDQLIKEFLDDAPSGDPIENPSVANYYSAGNLENAGVMGALEAARQESYIVGIEYCGEEPVSSDSVQDQYGRYFPTPEPSSISTPMP